VSVKSILPQITQQSLKASASSVLVLDAEEKELFFEVAKGQAKKVNRTWK